MKREIGLLGFILWVGFVSAQPYIAPLPTLVIHEGVDVEKALSVLYRFNPVNLQGLTYLIATPEKGRNCNGRIGVECWGSFEAKGDQVTITIFEADQQLTEENGILFANTLLHELGHLAAWQQGTKADLYGHLNEGEADAFVKQVRFCDRFLPTVSGLGFCEHFANLIISE